MSHPSRRRLSTGAAITVAVFLAIPTLALVLVPIYARKGPELWGFPFFYWYQMVWVVACGFFTGGAYLVIQRDRNGTQR